MVILAPKVTKAFAQPVSLIQTTPLLLHMLATIGKLLVSYNANSGQHEAKYEENSRIPSQFSYVGFQLFLLENFYKFEQHSLINKFERHILGMPWCLWRACKISVSLFLMMIIPSTIRTRFVFAYMYGHLRGRNT